MSCLIRFPDFKFKAFSLNYDDGAPADERLVSILSSRNLRATFNIISSNVGEGQFLTEEKIRSLYLDNGMEVAIHGQRHCSLAAVNSAVAMHDVTACKARLEAISGKIINGLAYANGSTSPEVKEILRLAGVEWARNSGSSESFNIPADPLEFSATCHHKNKRLNELAKQFCEEPLRSYYWGKTARLFIVWGHSFEFDRDDNWHIIENLADYMANREDVWYATCGEIFDYVRDFKSLRISADGTIIHNPTARTLYMHDFGRNIVVAPGETVDTKKL